MSMKSIRMGDYGQPHVFTIIDEDTGLPANVSAYDGAIHVYYTPPSGADNQKDKTAAFVSDGADGQVTYTPDAETVIDETGTWTVEARVTGTSKRLTSMPETFEVR